MNFRQHNLLFLLPLVEISVFFVGCLSGVYPCFTGVKSRRFKLFVSEISSPACTNVIIFESLMKVAGTKSASSF